mmetsp:Transcript_16798/g.38807  ORF Transcript_16798/g.38807 Transcript_16798/m.38807 type:complete len:365 (-) Transcript_16798:139-1233(-)|eukprot:CAMPEP_0197183132 /NCGR_PEP_ID=MMETSP1423-20130617/7503_1 /TAXON_ID=476441 /ORGANISM="Pseudo-nitzschia heimii, Strain UNC1101" /LENGTH=364 /DNA_ID=CAMNT_0042633679 /DNA_START=106 /DNA_END=1200 /DNA_ORIENTATION=+
MARFSCWCCSIRSLAVLAALFAVFVTVVNPVMNYLVGPLEIDHLDDTAPLVEKPFDPSTTDIMGYSKMRFVKEGMQVEYDIGITFIMKQSFPNWMVKLADRFSRIEGQKEEHEKKIEKKDLDILDARKHTGTFAERGFTLVDMEGIPSVRGNQNWRSPLVVNAFQADLEPRLHELYPGASRFEFTYSVVRGGTMFGDQPAAIDGPHLDYTQNDTARREFHDEYPPFSGSNEHHALLGNSDSETEEMRVLLGIWKPVMMTTPVCDHPLAIMDASTFQADQEALNPIHINFGVATFHNLNGAIHHHEDQRWYYYPFQTESEVLVFTQYSRGRHFCTPHGSFQNPNCPEDSDNRVSLEMRVAVFFPK